MFVTLYAYKKSTLKFLIISIFFVKLNWDILNYVIC